MKLSVGIVGLPNVGKSTLFQALTRKKVGIAPYPFTTIDKNVGIVEVEDERLGKLAQIFHSQKFTPTAIEFIDIAGLVKGAHKGEGLGNQFLAHIREVDGILHVVRAFEDENIPHVAGSVDPERDIAIVQTELILKDLETVEKRISSIERYAKGGKKEAIKEYNILQALESYLNQDKLALSFFQENPEAKDYLKSLQLLTAKPTLYLINYKTKESLDGLHSRLQRLGAPFLFMNAKEELDIGELSGEEKEALGVKPKLPELIKACYELLRLITFFTGNKNETRAWAIPEGTQVVRAAGIIHSDFEAKFIRAQVIPWDRLLESGSWHEAGLRGWIRTEGKEYLVKEGDVIEIKHS